MPLSNTGYRRDLNKNSIELDEIWEVQMHVLDLSFNWTSLVLKEQNLVELPVISKASIERSRYVTLPW